MANKDITETGVRSVLETMGIPSSFQGLKENAIGRAEALATIGTGMAGTMVGMGGSVFEAARGSGMQEQLDRYRQIQEAMTYMPRTQGGLERVQQIGELFEPVGQLYEQYGEAVGESTGSPLLGEYTEEFFDPLFFLGGLGGIPKRAGRVSKRVIKDFKVNKKEAGADLPWEEEITYTDPDSGGAIKLAKYPDGRASVIELYVPPESRGQGIGESLQKIALEENPVLMGQVSSKAAATTAYRLGRRPIDNPNATLEEVFKAIDENSSVNLVSPRVINPPDPTIQVDLGIPEARLDEIADQAIRAFHGSPYDFDKFDLNRIGSGEGAQTYGYGLYFAEAEDVAKTYKQAPEVLEGFDNFAMSDAANKYVIDISQNTDNGLIEYATSELLAGDFTPDTIKRKMRDFDDDFTPEEIDAAISEFDGILNDLDTKFSGTMYEVNIKASRDELLDWDKPLSEQPSVIEKLQNFVDKKVQEKNGNILLTNEYIQSLDEMLKYPEETKGWEVYSDFQDRTKGLPLEGKESKGQKASAILEEAGLKGIRYDDGLSRGKEGGTSNFVIFDPRIIDIAKKYGVAIPVAGAILMQSEGEQVAQPEA